MFGSSNPFAKAASSGSTFQNTSATFGKRISKEDSGNEEDVPPKRASFASGLVSNPFASVGDPSSSTSSSSFSAKASSTFGSSATGGPSGGFSFKPSGSFGTAGAKEVKKEAPSSDFTFRPTSIFGSNAPANDTIATDTSSFLEDPSKTPLKFSTAGNGKNIFSTNPQTTKAAEAAFSAPSSSSSTFSLKSTAPAQSNPFAAKTSFSAGQQRTDVPKATSFQLRSSFGGGKQETTKKPVFGSFSGAERTKAAAQQPAEKFDPVHTSSILLVKDLDPKVCVNKDIMRDFAKNVLKPPGLEKIAPVPLKKALKLFFRNTKDAADARARIENQFPSLKVRFGRDKGGKEEKSLESISSENVFSVPESDPFGMTGSSDAAFDTFGSSTNAVYAKQLNEQKKRHMEKSSEEELQPVKITRTIDRNEQSNSPFDAPEAAESDPRNRGNIFGKKPLNSEIQLDSPVTSFGQKTKNRASPEPSGFASFLKSSKSKADGSKRSQAASLAKNPDAIDIDLAEKRFKILETRDKTVRDVLIQELREGAQVGICADLCPEKEIYRRWTQQDISVLEMNEHGQIAIEKCIKVYQRSAADTEESLPNELRPASTLLDCCWYFCSEVCTEDVIEEIGADVWYDFMWKRTRAIRKDITQQHMSCLKTAQVLETVARYHIWCSHSMVLEDFWDQRINDENLEKTLTSIEHVYQDISVRGQYSAAEPEFRAYMIYLNLNDSGAVMKYLSRVPIRFKTHPLIKRARRIVSAYMLRHYAIFWNEFSKCTALEASILHRYMGNVRYHAMQILRRGYANNVLPMECFQKALFFKASDPNFETYMAAHNVFPNDDGLVSIVEMAKSFVAEPEVPLPKWKSKYIMEDLSANRTPGQLIWGIDLHLKPWSSRNYKPSSSFLPRSDRLIESANDIIENVRAKLEEDAQNRSDMMENLPENIAAREMEEEITNDVVDGQLREIASGVRIEEKVVAKQINDTMNLIIDDHIGWEVTRIYKNMLLQERLREEEMKNQIAEEKESIRQLKEEWKDQFLQRSISNMVDHAIGNFISSFVEENVDEAIATRNRAICENTALMERQNIMEEVVAEDVKLMLLEEIATVRRVHREKVAAVRQRRRDRISKQAALWWLRRTRIAISKRKARAATPRIGKRNILKEISQQNEQFMKMTIDRARRNCKKEVRQSHLYSIVYPDMDVSKFYLEHLVENINPRLNNFVASFSFYTDDKNVYNYLEKKFPTSGILGTRSKFIYLELANSEPQEGLVFDEEVYFGTSSKADIVVDFSNEEETNLNIESHLTDILLSTKPKNFTRMPYVKLLERVIVDTDSGLRCMDGLVKGYSHVRINQKPEVVLAWYNNLIEQMIRRMSMDGLDLHYPQRLVETGLVFGPTISSRHISILKDLKLPPISLDSSAKKRDPESCLSVVWKYLEKNKLFTTTLQVQISRVLNRKFNDDNQEEGFEKEKIFPWSDIISKIVESKLMRLHFVKEGRESVTVDDRLFRKYQPLPLVRKELKRIERKSPKMPKKYGFHKPRELEAAAPPAVEKTTSKNSIQLSTNSADLFAKSDSERMDTSVDEMKTAVTIETLFKGVESKFEDEISRSKQTLVDAKGTIATLKKDFERFQEMETLRAMVQSKPRPKDLTFMEHEKKILQAELDTKLTEIELMVAISKKHRDKIKEEYENMEPEEVNFDPSDMIDLEEPDNEPIDFEPSDMSDVFSKGPTDLNEGMSASDAAQSNDGLFAGDSRDSFKPSRDKTAGMAVSDDECSAAPGRIYDNPLISGPKKRLDEDESRMALSESESDSERDNRNTAEQDEPGPSSQVDDDEQDLWAQFPSQKNDELLSPRKEWVYAPVLAPDSQEQPHPDIPKPWDPEMTQGSQGSILSESVIPETQSTRAESPTQNAVSDMNSEEVPQGPQLLPHEVRDLLGIMSSQSTNDDEEDSSQLNDSTITVEDQDDDLQNFSVPDSQEVEEGAKEDPMNFWDDVEEEAQVVEEEVIAVNDSTNDSENCFEVDMHDENEMGEVTSSQEASSQEKSSLDNSQSSQEESVYVMSSQGSQNSVDFVPETQSTVNGNEVYVIPETQDEIEHNMDMYGDDPEGDSDDSGEDWNIYNINAQNIHHWESWNRQGRYEGTNMTYPEWLEREEQNERMMALEDEEDHMPIGQLFAQRYQQHGLGEYMNEQVAEEESSEEDEDERWRIEARNRRQRRRAAAPPPDNDEVICLDSD